MACLVVVLSAYDYIMATTFVYAVYVGIYEMFFCCVALLAIMRMSLSLTASTI